MMLLLVMLCSVWNVANAQVFETTYTVTKGSGGFTDEGHENLVDGNTSTKWCTSNTSSAYIEFHSAQAFVPTGYVLTTGNDNSSNPNRNPKSWVLKGKLNSTDTEWTTLATVTNDNTLEDKDYTPYEFSISNTQQYQYFRFEVTATHGANVMQLSEFQFKGYSSLTNISQGTIVINSYFDYNGGSNIAISYTVKNPTNETIDPSNYDAVITKGGSASNVAETGEYTLTVTGKGSYSGSKSATFKVLKKLTGEGTQASPYLISSTDDWNTFAERVSLGDTYNGKLVKLNADDVTASTIAGSSDKKCFQGVFLGNNKTLTLNLTATADGCAPFLYLKNATIQDLTIAGTISTGYKYGASIASYTYGTTTILNCVSTVAITSTRTNSSNDSHGGFVGVNQSGTLTFTNCTFAGKLLGGYSHQNGGFVGYANSSIVYNNCLFAPTQKTMGTYNSYTFNYNNNATFNGAFYTNAYSTAQGIRVYADVQTAFCKKEITYNATDYYSQLTPAVGDVNESYASTGSEISITPTLSYNNIALTQGTDYDYTITPATIQNPGVYTITFTGKGIYAGTYTKKFRVAHTFSGEGTSESPYLINNNTDWEHFAENINNGMTYSGMFLKLMDNITVTTMAGNSSSNSFRGTFDGNNNTMTLNLASDGDYCAPFKAVYGATIKNLVVDGSVTSSAQYASSLIGRIYNSDSVYINKCTSTAVITSTHQGAAYNGGFVGYTYYARFTDCVFAGKLLGASATNNGGFIGSYSSSNYTQHFTNCLFNPSEVTMSAIGSKTYSRTSNNSFTNTYFLTQFGEAQGIRLATATPANDVYKSEVVTLQGNNYYALCDITGINEFYLHTGSTIAVTPVVKLGSTTLTANTDYTVVIKNSSDVTVEPEDLKDNGNYNVTIAGTGDYTGSQTIAFRITSGESLNGYIFETGTDAEGTYYMINQASDFENLVSYVNSADNVTSGKRFKQTANITVSSMIGSSEPRSFQGVYDGQGNTLTLAIEATENIAAPFRYIKGASIKNLTIAGAIINSGKQNGGVAGYSYSDVTITDCTVSTSITSGFSGDSSNGGFIAHVQSGNVTIKNSVFCGRLLGANSSHSGGFVGWRNNTSNVLTFDNCLFAPAEVTMSANNSATFNRNGTANNTYTKCYYLTQFGDSQGVRITTDAPATGVYKSVVAVDDNNYYALCNVTGVKPLYDHTGSAVAVTPVVTFGDEVLTVGTDYTVAFSSAELIDKGNYTLTVTGTGNFAGSKTFSFRIVDGENFDGYVFETATDETGKYYVIASESDLQTLAAYVNSGHNASGMRFKQTDNITLTEEHTAIGTNSASFKGTYDGDNKTISGLVINKSDAEYQGLFGYLGSANAIIQKIVIVNCDITGGQYTGGIAGYMDSSNSKIQDCSVSGAIKVADGKSKDNIGGVLGYLCYGTVDNCVNTASVTGNGKYHGGVVGRVTGSTYLKNSFNAGVVEGSSYVGSITGANNGYLTNNYHTEATIGGVGKNGVTTGTDQTGAEVVVKITAGDDVTLNLPEKTYEWNKEKLYKSGTVVTLNYEVPEGKFFDRYTVNSGEISNAGIIDGEHTLTGFSEDVVITGNYVNDIIDLATAGAVIEDIDNLTYNGSEQHPVPVVTLATETLEENADYTVSYEEGCTNVGTYKVTVTGLGRYTGTVNKTFTIDPFNVSGCDITVSDKAYTGNAIEVTPTVKRGSTTLTQGVEKDYTFVTSPATVLDGGQYTLTIIGHGNYTGTKDTSFNIYYSVPTELVNTAVTATTATLTWKENGEATQWTIEYSTDKDFATSETVTVDAVPATLDGLTAETTYYARVKAVYGVGEESDWSNTCYVHPTSKLVVGSGASTSGNLPFHNFYYYNMTQQIYTAAELGNKAGTILSLDFYKTDNNSCNNTIDIYLVKTAKNSFGNNTDWISVTSSDKVYSGKALFENDKWSTITLDTPFDYDGTSNLALIVYDPKVDGDSYGNCYFRVFSGDNNQSICFYNDRLDPTINPTAVGNLSSKKNQLRIRLAEKINMNAHGIMTYASNNALDFKNSAASDDLKAYAVTDCNNGTLTLSKVNETPATEGLLLKGTANTEFYVNIVASANGITNNHLVGVLKADSIVGQTDGDKTNFVLANGNHGINWYGLKSAGAIGDHKAYLQLTTSEISGARAFTWIYDDGTETTGISNVANSQEPNANSVYDLQGRHIAQPTKKGLYIVNGRKTVVK